MDIKDGTTEGHFVCACVNIVCSSATEAFSVNCLRSIRAFAGCFLEINDVKLGATFHKRVLLRYRGISPMKVSLL